MPSIKELFIWVLGIVLVWVVVTGLLLLAVDALEFETTGACTDCIILHHLRSGL